MTVAAILAGGYGKRLRPLTIDRPKPLVEIAGKPILVYMFEWLRHYNITEIVLLLGYLKEKVIELIGSGSKYGVSVVYSIEDEPLGTGGGIKMAMSILARNEKFLIVNGDILTNLNPKLLFNALEDDFIISIAAVQLRSPYGILQFESDNIVASFREKPLIRDYWINAGVYGATPKIFEYLPERGDLERTMFPKLASERKIVAVKYDLENIYWRSIDTVKDLEEAEKELYKIKLY